MTTYYTPPHLLLPIQNTFSNQLDRQYEREGQLNTLELDAGDHSIYVFPNPPSAPPSPGSSLFSAPTDLSPSTFSSSPSRSRSRPRTRHHNTSFSVQTSSSRSLSAGQLGVNSGADVELWDWSGESTRDPPDDNESWVLEGEVERASRWDVALRLQQDIQRMSTVPTYLGNVPSCAAFDPTRHRLRLQSLHSRTDSRTGANSSFRSSNQNRSRSLSVHHSSPQPRIHIPLLSFLAKLLSLELDDPVIRLIAQAAPPDAESTLFPGNSVTSLTPDELRVSSLSSVSDSDAATDATTDSESEFPSEFDEDLSRSPHGLRKLLSPSADPSGAAISSLRAGMANSRNNPIEFVVPGIRGLIGLWRAMGEVYARSGQAWKEVWWGP